MIKFVIVASNSHAPCSHVSYRLLVFYTLLKLKPCNKGQNIHRNERVDDASILRGEAKRFDQVFRDLLLQGKKRALKRSDVG